MLLKFGWERCTHFVVVYSEYSELNGWKTNDIFIHKHIYIESFCACLAIERQKWYRNKGNERWPNPYTHIKKGSQTSKQCPLQKSLEAARNSTKANGPRCHKLGTHTQTHSHKLWHAYKDIIHACVYVYMYTHKIQNWMLDKSLICKIQSYTRFMKAAFTKLHLSLNRLVCCPTSPSSACLLNFLALSVLYALNCCVCTIFYSRIYYKTRWL